jgi:AraC-like DNA-binding protein
MATGAGTGDRRRHRATRGGFGAGRVAFWNGGALWMGHAAGAADAHAHHAMMFALALDAPRPDAAFLARVPPGEWVRCQGALVPAHVPHQFDGGGHAVALLLVEPETAAGRALRARCLDEGVCVLPGALAASLAAPLREAFDAGVDDAATLAAIARRAIDGLAGPTPAEVPVDPRIAAAIERIRAQLSSPITLAEVAASVHLSPGRFRHLFVAQTGSTFRAYLLWARVGAAVAAGMAGRSWTEAALEAGFADSAHLARTCRRMIGIAPGMLAPAASVET